MNILVLICKNEIDIIARCLSSVKPHIGYWLVVDTGSTDGTQALVQQCMAGVPGQLLQRPWVNFAENRYQALAWAETIAQEGDYFLLMDADDQLEVAEHYSWPRGQSHYLAHFHLQDMVYSRPLLCRADAGWRYRGVVHEYLVSPNYSAAKGEILPELRVIARSSGARSRDPHRFLRDAQLLEAELKRNPNDTRSMFYLGQSYADHGDIEQAIRAYQRRTQYPQGAPEVYYAYFQMANLKFRRQDAWGDVLQAYLEAWNHAPHRAEPLYVIAQEYRRQKKWSLAKLFASTACAIPLPADDLFVRRDVYLWRSRLLLAEVLFELNQYQAAAEYLQQLQPHELPEQAANHRQMMLLACQQAMSPSTQSIYQVNGRIVGKVGL